MGRPLKDISGQRFGELTVLSMVPRAEWKHDAAEWLCKCDCGTTKAIKGGHLRNGGTVSCGHKRDEALTAANQYRQKNGREIGDGNTIHGMWDTPTYKTWIAMKSRTENPNSTHYRWYGAKGVTICERWRTSFVAFLEDMGERPEGLTIDRIDPYGNYEPGNCRWADSETQAYNKRANAR